MRLSCHSQKSSEGPPAEVSEVNPPLEVVTSTTGPTTLLKKVLPQAEHLLLMTRASMSFQFGCLLLLLAGDERDEGLYMGQAVTAQDPWRELRILIG